MQYCHCEACLDAVLHGQKVAERSSQCRFIKDHVGSHGINQSPNMWSTGTPETVESSLMIKQLEV